jgi:hypothetical protein
VGRPQHPDQVFFQERCEPLAIIRETNCDDVSISNCFLAYWFIMRSVQQIMKVLHQPAAKEGRFTQMRQFMRFGK